jgi:hypothetical protein
MKSTLTNNTTWIIASAALLGLAVELGNEGLGIFSAVVLVLFSAKTIYKAL